MKKRATSQKADDLHYPRFREIKCYFAFSPPGESNHEKEREFLRLFYDAQDWKVKKQSAEIDARAKDMAKQERAFSKTEEGKLWKALSTMIEKAVAKNPSKYDDAWFSKNEESLKNAGIYELTKLEVEGVAKKNEWARSMDIIEAERRALSAVETLLSGLLEGRKDAAEGLLELGLRVTGFLERFYESNPELFRETAASYAQIPVIAGLNPKWVDAANMHLEHLCVGRNLVHSRFKSLAYDDEYFVCRAWAREVVKCIDQNRYTWSMVVDICDYIQKSEGDASVLPAKMPSWLTEVPKLPPFANSTAKQWASLARKVIREETPNFHERPEFARLVSSIRGRFRDAPGKPVKRIGTIQNAILDKIGEAIESIVAS